MCIRGVFPSCIYVVDSHRISIFAYFEKQSVTGFSWYQIQVRNKTDQVHTCDLRRVIFTLQYILILLTQCIESTWESSALPLKIYLVNLIMFLIPTFSSDLNLLIIPIFHLNPIFPPFDSWHWPLHFEAGRRNQSAQRNRGGPIMHLKATWSEETTSAINHPSSDSCLIVSTCILCWFIINFDQLQFFFIIFPAWLKFRQRNFC